jgi:subtilisin family serine protease
MKALAVAMAAVITAVAVPAQAGTYLVVFKSQNLPADAVQRVAAQGGKLQRSFDAIGVAAVSGDAAFATRMQRDSGVLAVGSETFHAAAKPVTGASEPDVAQTDGAPLPSDTRYPYQWDMRRIGAPAVWARLPVAPVKARVAVLDVGVMDNHPDLVGQIDASVSTSYCNTPGGPGNTAGYPKYSTLIDFDAHPDWSPADGCTPATTTYEPHGTHVSGTVAAKFGGGRVVGVAPDGLVGAYKVFDRYRYTDPTAGLVDKVGAFDGPLFAAIIDATQKGYLVISMSLGGEIVRNQKGSAASWHAWDRVAKWADRNGALLAAAAGNEEFDLNGPIANLPGDLSTVMSVSATGTSQLVVNGGNLDAAPGSDVLAFYSNYGAAVDIAAPGGDCGPTYPSGCEAPYLILSDYIFPDTGAPGYAWFAGTSMATPHVSAVAAYVRAIHPDWTTGHVRAWLKSSAQNVGSRQQFGAGLLDADAAVR